MKTFILTSIIVSLSIGCVNSERLVHRRYNAHRIRANRELTGSITCQGRMEACLRSMDIYKHGGEEILEELRQNGIGNICLVYGGMVQCSHEVYNDPQCANITSPLWKERGREIEIGREKHTFFCKQKFQDIEANRECIANIRTYQFIMSCCQRLTLENRTPGDPCSRSKDMLNRCISEAVGQIDACQPRTEQLIIGVLEQLGMAPRGPSPDENE